MKHDIRYKKKNTPKVLRLWSSQQYYHFKSKPKRALRFANKLMDTEGHLVLYG